MIREETTWIAAGRRAPVTCRAIADGACHGPEPDRPAFPHQARAGGQASLRLLRGVRRVPRDGAEPRLEELVVRALRRLPAHPGAARRGDRSRGGAPAVRVGRTARPYPPDH